MSPRIRADVLPHEHETRMHDPRGMSARSDKNVRWSRHGPPAVHQFCPWGYMGRRRIEGKRKREKQGVPVSFWLRPYAGWISRGNCDFIPCGIVSFSLSSLSLHLLSFPLIHPTSSYDSNMENNEDPRLQKIVSRHLARESAWKLNSIQRFRARDWCEWVS